MEPLDHILGRLDELRISFLRNIADIAKTNKNQWIFMVFDGLRGLGRVLGGLRPHLDGLEQLFELAGWADWAVGGCP